MREALNKYTGLRLCCGADGSHRVQIDFANYDDAWAFFYAADRRQAANTSTHPDLIEVLKNVRKACLCSRNTKGFDYHQRHPNLGTCKSGSERWATPSEMIDDALRERGTL